MTIELWEMLEPTVYLYGFFFFFFLAAFAVLIFYALSDISPPVFFTVSMNC